MNKINQKKRKLGNLRQSRIRPKQRPGFELLEVRHLLAANAIVTENLLPGSPASEWDIVGNGDLSIQGYATDISVDQGGTVEFKIDSQDLAPYRVDIYRIGYYGGDGARKVDTIPAAQTLALAQPAAIVDPATGVVDAGNWLVTASWDVPASATSGVYIARATRADTGGASHIIFVVRDDDGESDLLFQTADTTWQAYNRWGGNSLYVGPYNGRAYGVSYNRPFDTRGVTAKDWFFSSEYATVRFLEKNGYDVSYTTGVDSHRFGDEILEHKAFLSVGHDEYWSATQRANVEAARDAGVSLAFFSGNEVYWKTRWEDSIDGNGTPLRTLISYKETWDNAKIDPEPGTWTGTWRDDRFSPPADGGNPENALTGQIFTVNRGPGGDTGTPFTVDDRFADLRFWRDTRVAELQPGETTDVGDYVLGYEWDEDLDNGFRPAGLFRMSSTTQNVPQKIDQYGGRQTTSGVATHSLTMYRAQSGALVFGAGTINWGWGLDGTHDVLISTPDPAIQQATVNLFADMGVQPATLQQGLVQATISTDVTAPLSVISAVSGGAVVTGGVPVTITGTASDVGGAVGGVEVSTDGGRSWRRADGEDNWSYTWVPAAAGPATIISRAVDDSANLEIPTSSVSVTVELAPTSNVGLVAAWDFNEGSGTTLIDRSGTGNNGTVVGATYTAGVSETGLFFDGTDDFVSVADDDSLDLDNGLTVEAWVQPADIDGWTSVVFKEAAGGLSYALYASDNTNNPPAGYVRVAAGDPAARGAGALELLQWNHLAMTHDGFFVRLYVNGALVSQTAATGNVSSSDLPLAIGGNSVFANEYFHGLVDEVRIYNRALGQAEIFYNMSTPVGGVTDSAVPTGAILSPSNDQSVSGNMTVSVAANDNVGVGSVTLFVDGQWIVDDFAAPYQITIDTAPLPDGNHTLTGIVRDVAGNATALSPVSFLVANNSDNLPPEVDLRFPTGARPVSGTTVLNAVAEDNVGVAGVQFRVNGVDVGPEDLVAPYRVPWNSQVLPDGDYEVTALARDAAGNIASSSRLVTVDNTAPVIETTFPADAELDLPLEVSVVVDLSEDIRSSIAELELRDSQDQVVPGTVDYNAGGFRLTWIGEQEFSPGEVYTATLRKVEDIAGNQAAELTWTFETSSTVVDASLWDDQTVPQVASASDPAPVELGMRFQTVVNGYITGVQFYKGSGNTGIHVGNLWSNDGQLLASANFTGESAVGWQTVTFDQPVQVNANTSYVVSYFAPNGGYAFDSGYFSSGYTSGPFVVVAEGTANPNGLFFYGPNGGFPVGNGGGSNYWVDVLFSNNLVDETAPEVVGNTPSVDADNIGVSVSPTVTFSESVTEASIHFVLQDDSGTTVPATVSWNSAARTAMLVPDVPLETDETYTATVSGAVDNAGNEMQPFSWEFTTEAIADQQPPAMTARSPSINATGVSIGAGVSATFNEVINASTLSIVVIPGGGLPVSGTVDWNPASFTATFTPEQNLSLDTVYTVSINAEDLSGNATTASWLFTTEAVVSASSVWDLSVVPTVTSAADTASVELGVKFRSASDGFVKGLEFYKGALNTGTHVGSLWTADGQRLANVTFTNESQSGWQRADFDVPVPVTANTTYVASYFAPDGGYSFDGAYFADGDVTNGPLTALGQGTDGGNGVYRYGNGGLFPNQSFNASNYWVDVVFASDIDDEFPPTVITRSPEVDAVAVATSDTIEATFNEVVVESTISLILVDDNNVPVPASVSYSASTGTVTLTPNSALAHNATYTATVSGAEDSVGNVMVPVSWSFTTTPGVSTASSIWDLQATPAVASANDPSAVELGVKFRAVVEGSVTALRFYKGALNTGTHVGRLWSVDGTPLATATYTNESATGWQEVELSSPVQLVVGVTYVVSYYAPNGGYAFDGGYFHSGSVTNGALTALGQGVDGGNGVYRYGVGGGFPNSSFNASNYWVDVVFEQGQESAALQAVQIPLLVSLASASDRSPNLVADKTQVKTREALSLNGATDVIGHLPDQPHNPLTALTAATVAAKTAVESHVARDEIFGRLDVAFDDPLSVLI